MWTITAAGMACTVRHMDAASGHGKNSLKRLGKRGLLHHKCCTLHIRPFMSDWDGDGDLDLLVGQTDGSLLYFERTHSGHLVERAVEDNPPLDCMLCIALLHEPSCRWVLGHQ